MIAAFGVAALSAATAVNSTAPLVRADNLIYEGAFRVPAGLRAGGQANAGFEYGGTAIAFNPAHQSLLIVGHDWDQLTAEVSIPKPGKGPLETLETAALLQPLTDVSQGKKGEVGPNTVKIGGLLAYRDRLYMSAYVYYDGPGAQRLSHFVSSLDLSVRTGIAGPFQVGSVGAGFVSGFMGLVPAPWQAALGGPVLTGNCCLPIIGRTSFGPAVFAMDPMDLGSKNPVPATPLLYYPEAHQSLGPWASNNQYFGGSTEIRGVVFPENSRSVLFFGRQGLGDFCYGPGTGDQSQVGKPADGGVDRWCFDPVTNWKGPHSFPYSAYVWAYDANDLATVKAGHKRPWDLRPYGVWKLALPLTGDGKGTILGTAYDPASGRIFVSQGFADDARPVIHVFTVSFSS